MKDSRHIIWTDYLDYDDWKEDLEAQYPELSANERMNLMYEINGTYFQDEKTNLDIQLSRPILVVGDLGLWHGRRMGYKEIESGNISDCLYTERDIDNALGLWIKTAISAARRFITTAQTTTSTAPTRTAFPKRKSTI